MQWELGTISEANDELLDYPKEPHKLESRLDVPNFEKVCKLHLVTYYMRMYPYSVSLKYLSLIQTAIYRPRIKDLVSKDVPYF